MQQLRQMHLHLKCMLILEAYRDDQMLVVIVESDACRKDDVVGVSIRPFTFVEELIDDWVRGHAVDVEWRMK